MVPISKFYDTCSLLRLQEQAFTEKFFISSITLHELEGIKTSNRKDESTKAQARQLLRLLVERPDEYTVWTMTVYEEKELEALGYPVTADNCIVMCAKNCWDKYDDITFVTDDMVCGLLAKTFKMPTEIYPPSKIVEEYKGYREFAPTEECLALLYADMSKNIFDLNVNEYIILRDEDGEVVDIIKWDGTENKRVAPKQMKSRALGTIRAMDEYQRCAFDALQSCDVVALSGRSGTGKTTIPLAYLMQGLETQKIRKLHIIGHFEPLKGSRQLGFMKGDRLQKQMTTGSLGGILESKFTDLSVLDGMFAAGTVSIVSTSDLRGVEFGAEDAVFVTEAQDIDAYTIRTIIQRCKEGCKQIYEGDLRQIDISKESGFPKMIDVFKGNESFACVKLRKDYRSPLGILADKIV